MVKRYTNGLVLSGGGARGFAHLGAIQALEEHNWKVEVLSGVSAGALVGVFYAAGYKPREVLDILKELEILDYSKVQIPKGGFLKLSGLQKLLQSSLPVTNFNELKIPMYVAATNLNLGRIEYFREGNVVDAVVASSSIPVLFQPHKIGKYYYVDGGVWDNLPAKPIRKLTKRLLAIHVNPIHETKEVNSLSTIAARVFQLSVASTVSESMEMCDMIVQPENLDKYHILDNSAADKLYETGYQEMNKVLGHKKKAFKSSFDQLLKISI